MIRYETRKLYPSATRTEVRQILHDGQPAVEVTNWQRGHYYDGDTIPSERIVSRKYYRFPTPRPVEVLGRPVVGQWADKEINGYRGTIEDNNDAATHIDYAAWVDAFHEIYSDS